MGKRSAVSTIKGYFYQFDYTILQLLLLKSASDSIIIEGIEDIDVETTDEKVAIQCKYYESTEYNHSVIAEAIRYLIRDFSERERTGERKINYMLYGYYSKGHEKFPDILDYKFLKEHFLTYKYDGVKYEEFSILGLSDKKLKEFLNVLKIDIHASKYEGQMQDILSNIQKDFSCSLFEAEHYYYNTALSVIKNMAIEKEDLKRKISKGEFIRHIDKKEILFNKWFYIYKTQKEIFNKIRKEYFTTFNVSPFERFFLIEINELNYNRTEVKDIIYLIIEKWTKCSKREPKPFCPYIYLHNITAKELVSIKQELIDEGISLSDGFLFQNAEFNSVSLAKQVSHENITQIKFINEVAMLKQLISHVNVKVEIFQFYNTEVFYADLNDKKHIKIQINDIKKIKEII